jgi:hypothetical protein
MSRSQPTDLRAWMDGLDKTETSISMWFLFFKSSDWNLVTNGRPISAVLLLVWRTEFADTSGRQLQRRKLGFYRSILLASRKGRKQYYVRSQPIGSTEFFSFCFETLLG